MPLQEMRADLPTAHLVPDGIFSKVGLEFTRTFLTAPKKSQGVELIKSYVCLFICCITKVIYLEIVQGPRIYGIA
ncbi:hypothetical protein CDAR_1701 [Caerostris darwini]|uniref:Uncharacterized protein n=1 Tax=Caerostris darwini TaxID=1538125 RepID=A0AAV4RAR3_9ARAC|nr:hypothetical protein CDAR_1701 [Caerostris darwini]